MSEITEEDKAAAHTWSLEKYGPIARSYDESLFAAGHAVQRERSERLEAQVHELKQALGSDLIEASKGANLVRLRAERDETRAKLKSEIELVGRMEDALEAKGGEVEAVMLGLRDVLKDVAEVFPPAQTRSVRHGFALLSGTGTPKGDATGVSVIGDPDIERLRRRFGSVDEYASPNELGAQVAAIANDVERLRVEMAAYVLLVNQARPAMRLNSAWVRDYEAAEGRRMAATTGETGE